jgi:GNAT superfamily N-acetyltransferase
VKEEANTMNNQMKSRVATLDDTYELARLNAVFNGVQVGPEQLSSRLANPHCVETPIVAEVGNCIVGFASLCLVPRVFYDTPHAELTELFVQEAYRRRGIGRALVAHAERLACEGGATELFVLTGFTNREAQSLYHAMGYEDDRLAMCKALLGE